MLCVRMAPAWIYERKMQARRSLFTNAYRDATPHQGERCSAQWLIGTRGEQAEMLLHPFGCIIVEFVEIDDLERFIDLLFGAKQESVDKQLSCTSDPRKRIGQCAGMHQPA